MNKDKIVIYPRINGNNEEEIVFIQTNNEDIIIANNTEDTQRLWRLLRNGKLKI